MGPNRAAAALKMKHKKKPPHFPKFSIFAALNFNTIERDCAEAASE